MGPIIRTLCLGLVLLLPSVSASLAQDRTIYLLSGTASPIELDRSFEMVLVGNPDLIDVHRLSDRLVVVEALAAGTSNVVFVDRRSIAIANIRIIISDSNAM